MNQLGSHIITYPNGSQCVMNGGISILIGIMGIADVLLR